MATPLVAWYRFEGPSLHIRDAYAELPTVFVDLALAVTDLGGMTFLMVLVSLLYWLSDRRAAAVLASYALVAAALIFALKFALEMPRPPADLFLAPLDDDPHGFPSGHAFIAVVVYGGALQAFRLYRDWFAVGVVTLTVALIGLSRVVLGFHYLGDVLAGWLLGALYLVAMAALTAGDPRRGFAIAFALSIPTFVVTGPYPEVLLAVGGSVGGLLAAWDLERVPPLRSVPEAALLVALGLVVLIAGTVGANAVASAAATAVVYGLLVAGVLLLPAGIGRIDADVLGGDESRESSVDA